jgi:hypothetical protein
VSPFFHFMRGVRFQYSILISKTGASRGSRFCVLPPVTTLGWCYRSWADRSGLSPRDLLSRDRDLVRCSNARTSPQSPRLSLAQTLCASRFCFCILSPPVTDANTETASSLLPSHPSSDRTFYNPKSLVPQALIVKQCLCLSRAMVLYCCQRVVTVTDLSRPAR